MRSTDFIPRKIGVVDGTASCPFSLARGSGALRLRTARPADGHGHPQGAWVGRRIRRPHPSRLRTPEAGDTSESRDRRASKVSFARPPESREPLRRLTSGRIATWQRCSEGFRPQSGSSWWTRRKPCAGCLVTNRSHGLPICCGSTSRAIWAELSTDKESSTPRNTDGTKHTRGWRRKLSRNSSRIMTRNAGDAGLRKRMERGLAPSSSRKHRRKWQSCGCCM